MRRRLIDVEPVVSNVADHPDKLGGVRGGMTRLSTSNLPGGYECLCQQDWREKNKVNSWWLKKQRAWCPPCRTALRSPDLSSKKVIHRIAAQR